MTQDMNQKSVVELELLASDIRAKIRSKMVEDLRGATKVVTFTKVNGDKRVMTCTLDSTIIPDFSDVAEKAAGPVNEEVLAVWDVKAKGWRSFRIDNVTDFE